MFSYFENLLKPFPEEEPSRPPATLAAFCFHYCKGAKFLLAGMAILSAAIAMIEVRLFAYLGNIIDSLGSTDKQMFWQQQGPDLLNMLLVCLLLYPLLMLLQTVLIHQSLLGNLPMIMRWQAHRFLLRHSISFFNNEFAGRIGTKVMQTSLAVRETVMKLLDILVYVSVYALSTLWLMASNDIRLMLPLLIWLIIYVSLLVYFVPRLKRISTEQADARALMTGRVIDSYTNISTVKLFSHAGKESAYAKAGMDTFLDTVYRQMRLSSALTLCVDIGNVLTLIASVALGIYLWSVDAVGVGAVAIASGVILRMHGMAHWVMWETSALFENIGIVQDGMSTLSKKQTVVDLPNAVDLSADQSLDVTGEVTFDSVSFNYGKQDLPLIEELSFRISPGENIGLVGRSGAGKTTIVNLLLRLYDVQSGKILIDGRNIAEVTQESLRAHIGVVTQDTSLLHRSVYENIAYGRQEATRDEVVEAAKRANALEFIESLEDVRGRRGFDAHVGERGVTLSGGQRQRIAIARVFLKDAPILLLDEATSALDSEVEAAIQENLGRLMQGKTVIAIAHRLSTIAALDRLLILDRGRLIDQGSHAELIERGGLYADLWHRQSGGFIAE